MIILEEKNNNVKVDEQKNKKRIESKSNKQKKKRNIIVLMAGIIAIIVAYILFRGSYLETLEIGEIYIDIFWQNIKYTSITLIANFLVIYSMIYFTTNKIKNTLKDFFKAENKQMPKLPNKSIAFILGIIISSITSKVILGKLLLCFNSTLFGIQDPIFGYDIGYFIFQKPFIELVIMYLLIAVVILAVYSAIYYIITFNFCFEGIDRQTLKKSPILKQLIKYIRILAILIAGMVYVKTRGCRCTKILKYKRRFGYIFFVWSRTYRYHNKIMGI